MKILISLITIILTIINLIIIFNNIKLHKKNNEDLKLLLKLIEIQEFKKNIDM